MKTAGLHLHRPEYENTVEARVDTIALFYSPRKIGELIENNRNSPRSIATHVAAPITGSIGHRMTSGHQTAKAQLAGTLLMVARCNYEVDNQASNFLISLRDIADYLGFTINEICHELQTMDRQGTISIRKSNEIALADLEALQEIAMESPK